MQPLIEINQLVVGFPIYKGLLRRLTGHKIVLDECSLQIHRGTTLGLVGESGSGKTTIGRAILGLVPVLGGSVRYYPEAHTPYTLSDLSDSAFRPLRKKLQVIFQDPYSSLNPRLHIGEILEEGLRIHFPKLNQEERTKKCQATLDRVGLSAESLNRFPHEFSGGQRQRISIARALVLDPEFIVCDECVSALDVSIQAQILNLLMELQTERRLTYLFISHDLSVVRHISRDICVLSGGKIVESGPSADITSKPKHEYTQKLLSAIPSLVPSRV